MSVGEEEVVRLHEPPVVREVRLGYSRLGQRPLLRERLREHVRALAFVVCRLEEARHERRVADRGAFLVEANLVAPVTDTNPEVLAPFPTRETESEKRVRTQSSTTNGQSCRSRCRSSTRRWNRTCPGMTYGANSCMLISV